MMRNYGNPSNDNPLFQENLNTKNSEDIDFDFLSNVEKTQGNDYSTLTPMKKQGNEIWSQQK